MPMTTGELLAKLFDLNQYTSAWNSPRAAQDFWAGAAVALCIAIAVAIAFSSRHHGTPTS
jgi:hypothetical protein